MSRAGRVHPVVGNPSIRRESPGDDQPAAGGEVGVGCGLDCPAKLDREEESPRFVSCLTRLPRPVGNPGRSPRFDWAETVASGVRGTRRMKSGDPRPTRSHPDARRRSAVGKMSLYHVPQLQSSQKTFATGGWLHTTRSTGSDGAQTPGSSVHASPTPERDGGADLLPAHPFRGRLAISSESGAKRPDNLAGLQFFKSRKA